jgi:hypothetical protein
MPKVGVFVCGLKGASASAAICAPMEGILSISYNICERKSSLGEAFRISDMYEHYAFDILSSKKFLQKHFKTFNGPL